MNLMQLGVTLKAFDQMSSVIRNASNNAIGRFSAMEKRVDALSNKINGIGTSLAAEGAMITGLMSKPIGAFAEAEDASTQLRIAMMQAGGEVDKRFANIDALATRLGTKLPGTTADLQRMMTTLIEQGMTPEAILGGVGEAAANLGVVMKMPYDEAANFAAKLQDATGTAEKDMMGLMDTIQRSSKLGVQSANMLQAYTKLSPVLDLMQAKGLQGARDMAPFVVMMDQAGMKGEAAGNAIRKMVSAGMDADKLAKVNSSLAAKGIKLDFSDGKGEFGGLAQMLAQMEQLRGLDTQTRLDTISTLFGDDAEVAQVVGKLIEKGADGYNEVVDKMARQATLQQRVNAQLGTLKSLWDAATGTFTTALAGFGEAISPELKALTEWLGEASGALGQFIEQHPKLAKVAGIAVGGLGALMVVGGGLALTLGTLTKLGGMATGALSGLGSLAGLRKGKGPAGAAGAALDLLGGVQKVFVVNMPGGGMGMPDIDADGGKGKKGGRLSRLAQKAKSLGGRALGMGGSVLASGRVALMAPTLTSIGGLGAAGVASSGAMVAGAGVAGYGAGTLINKGAGTVSGWATDGKHQGDGWLGSMLYSAINRAEERQAGSAVTLAEVNALRSQAGRAPLTSLPGGKGAQLAVPMAPVSKAALAPVSPAAIAPLAQSATSAGKQAPALPHITVTLSPQVTIHGDPTPASVERFRRMLADCGRDVEVIINKALANKQRVAYGGG